MDERFREQAVEAARWVLKRFRESNAQWADDTVPLDKLASWLGLEIATFGPSDYPKGTYGFLEPGENLIWLYRNLSDEISRFTLAHEMGHAILHRHVEEQYVVLRLARTVEVLNPEVSSEDQCTEDDVRTSETERLFEDQVEELQGIGIAYNPRSQREIEANIFAAELLMPLERIRTLYLSSDIRAGELADIFGVSRSAMLNRLAALLMPGKTDGGLGEDKHDDINKPHLHTKTLNHPEKSFDEFQRAAIEAPTPALIVAGPGSGKTSTLIGRVEYLIHTQDVAPEHILALTFSRKAAEEMQERLRGALDPQSAFPTISTFHAFCAEQLRTYWELAGLRQDFACLDDAEGYFLLLRLANELPLRHYQHLSMPALHFPAILSGISRAKDELVSPAEYTRLAMQMLQHVSTDEEIERAEKALEIAEIYRLYQAALERQQDTDFGGLIMLTVHLLHEHAEVRLHLQQKYQHILVDEFQDINWASGILLRELAGDARNVWVVGDANQAIYGFRGASPANIANFRNDYAGAVVLPLSRNYRSRPDIVSFADAFRDEQLESSTIQPASQTARSTAVDCYVTLAVSSDETSELDGLIDDIRRKLAMGYAFRDIVILCRTRAQARKFSQALSSANLPVIERGGLLEQEHIKNLLSIVMLLADSSGMGLLRAARQPEHALVQCDIEALLQAAREQGITPMKLLEQDNAPIEMSSEGRIALARLSNILGYLKSPQNVQNMWSLLADYLFIETSLVRDLLSEPADARSQAVLADYTHLLQLARSYDQQQQMQLLQQQEDALAHGKQLEERKALPIHEQARGLLDYLSVLKTLRNDGGNRRQDDEAEGEETPDVIRVMTVHASKGLEFPIVYLPGIVKNRFPIQRRSKSVEPPQGMLPAESEGDTAHEIGEACLFYVGATRARDHLVLSYAERYGKKNYKRSSYIDALVAGLSQERIKRVVWKAMKRVEDDQENISRTGSGRMEVSSIPTSHLGDGRIESSWFEPFTSHPSDEFIEKVEGRQLTSSDVETYQGCPRQYMYGVIYGFRGAKTAYGAFRKATQNTVKELSARLEAHRGQDDWNRELLTEQDAEDLYTQQWQEVEGDTFPFATLYERHGHEISELMRRKLLSRSAVNWQLQQPLMVDIAGRSVEVKVDRVEVPEHAGEPVKFVRTSFGKRKEKPPASTHDMLYARASRQHHAGRTVELQAHNMSTGETYPITLTSKKEQGLYDQLEQAILGMERHEYPPKPDAMKCPGCPFFLMCPA
jgi:superfamily I DNA/RNA helicase/Zn-dependent peptidase ImmA (M78 family)/CRISPR/Cas system-associated exonuclease Cas4 (RecB family)